MSYFISVNKLVVVVTSALQDLRYVGLLHIKIMHCLLREEKSFVEVYDFITQLMKTDAESLNMTEKAKGIMPYWPAFSADFFLQFIYVTYVTILCKGFSIEIWKFLKLYQGFLKEQCCRQECFLQS